MKFALYLGACPRHVEAYEFLRGWNDRVQLQVLLGHMVGCPDCKLAWEEKPDEKAAAPRRKAGEG